MKKKQLAIVAGIFCLFVIVYGINRNTVLTRLSILEKQQLQILRELRTLKKTIVINQETSEEITLEDIGKIRERLAKLQNQLDRQHEILGFIEASPSSSPTLIIPEADFIAIADRKWSKVDVYENPNSSSKIIGQAVYGKNYPFSKKENGYYYIKLDNNLWGYIHQQFVKEY